MTLSDAAKTMMEGIGISVGIVNYLQDDDTLAMLPCPEQSLEKELSRYGFKLIGNQTTLEYRAEPYNKSQITKYQPKNTKETK